MAFLIGGILERSALDNPQVYAVLASALAIAALLIRHRTKAQASSESAALQFDDPPDPAILSLGLYRDGILPLEPAAPEHS
jgi:hypothetical protein